MGSNQGKFNGRMHRKNLRNHYKMVQGIMTCPVEQMERNKIKDSAGFQFFTSRVAKGEEPNVLAPSKSRGLFLYY